MKKINKEKWSKLLANKTADNHAEVMQKLGITEEEDKKWHVKYGGTPADFSKLSKS